MNPEVLNLLVPVAVPLVVALVKLGLPKIPKVYLPVLAIFLGMASQLVAHYESVGVSNLVLGAVLGGAGVGLRELVDQVTKLLAPEAPAPPAP